MEYKRKKFEERGFDEVQYKKYFQQNQAEYIRKKLRSVYMYHQGKSFGEISAQLSQHEQSTRKYINQYIEQGFSLLCDPVVQPQESLLTKA